jgi:hypothetical protein
MELEARRALGTGLDGAARGRPRFPRQGSPSSSPYGFARCARLGVATPLVLTGKARRGVVHGEMAARRAQQLAARRHAHRQEQNTRPAQRRREKATALTAGRRCRRRRPGVGGGAASVFTAAPALVRLLLGHARLLPRPAPRDLVQPPQQRAGGGAASVPRLASSSSTLPLPLPPTAERLWEGAKPHSGLVAVVVCFLPSSLRF